MKIALLIGNANYDRDDSNLNLLCAECNSSNNMHNLSDVYSSLKNLKEAFEAMNYIVISFIDLNSEEYLRAIRFFRSICEQAERVSVMLYVAGHGYHFKHQDFLVPINARKLIHLNGHNTRGLNQTFSMSCLDNLLENFISEERKQKYNVICLWDLCRQNW